MEDDNTVLGLLRKTDRGRLLFETAKQVHDLGPDLMSRISDALYRVGAVTKRDESVRQCANDIGELTVSIRQILREVVVAHRFGYALRMFDEDALPVPHMLEEDLRLAAEAVVSNVERFHEFDDTPPPFFQALDAYRACCHRIETYLDALSKSRFSAEAQEARNVFANAVSFQKQLNQS